MSMTENEKKKRFTVSGIIMVCGLIVVTLVHEIGHAIGFSLVNIKSVISFEIWNVGPVLVTRPLTSSTALEFYFTGAFGPVFATAVFGILGRFWRMECYVAAVSQLFYIPVELLTQVFGVQSELWAVLFGIAFILPPVVFVTMRVFHRRLKQWSD